MTKMRQLEFFQHHASPLFKNLPAAGRDDSPVSVIAHSAVISHPSSASTSMEHHIFRDAKLQQLWHEHEYSTSEDDAIANNLALSQEFQKVRALESLPETHSVPSNALHRETGWLLEDHHQKAELTLQKASSNKSVSSETDSTASVPEVSDESSGEHFSGFIKEDGEASIFFSPSIDGTGFQEETIVVKPNFRRDGRRLISDEMDAEHGGHSGKRKHNEWRHEQTSAYGQSKESLVISKPLLAAKEFRKSDWLPMKSTDRNVSIKNNSKEEEEDAWKPNALEDIDSCVATTPLSPGRARMSGRFAGVQNLAGSQINQGALDASRVSSGAAIKPGSVRSLPNYTCGSVGRGCFSRTLPSKWEDAEKWLVSVDSPSHNQVRSAVASAKAFQHRNLPVNRNIDTPVRRPVATLPGAKPADYSFSCDETVGTTLTHNQSATAAASDSELPKALEYRALVRSGSQKYRRQRNYGESSCGAAAGREEVLHNLRSYGGRGNGTQAIIHDIRSMEMDASFSDANKEKWGSLRPCSVHGVQALGGAIGKPKLSFSNKDDVGERVIVLQPGALADILTQDKYADTVVKTPKYGGGAPNPLKVSQEYVMQTSRRARSAFMKDASTEISPAVSRRDMATQVTPQPSSRTSRCSTPLRNSSPPRHNTPARRSASFNNTSGVNLLELESCHLAKLELRDLPVNGEFQSFDRSVSVWSTREEEEESSACLRPLELPDNKFNLLEARASAWEEAERAKFTVKYKREEARVDGWENLQRAKAEAEIKKLEVKLEKLRSQASEKIINKLTIALRRAQEMRVASEVQHAEQLARIAERATNIRKNGHFPANFGVCFARKA